VSAWARRMGHRCLPPTLLAGAPRAPLALSVSAALVCLSVTSAPQNRLFSSCSSRGMRRTTLEARQLCGPGGEPGSRTGPRLGLTCIRNTLSGGTEPLGVLLAKGSVLSVLVRVQNTSLLALVNGLQRLPGSQCPVGGGGGHTTRPSRGAAATHPHAPIALEVRPYARQRLRNACSSTTASCCGCPPVALLGAVAHYEGDGAALAGHGARGLAPAAQAAAPPSLHAGRCAPHWSCTACVPRSSNAHQPPCHHARQQLTHARLAFATCPAPHQQLRVLAVVGAPAPTGADGAIEDRLGHKAGQVPGFGSQRAAGVWSVALMARPQQHHQPPFVCPWHPRDRARDDRARR